MLRTGDEVEEELVMEGHGGAMLDLGSGANVCLCERTL